jgi:hypothetical protein
MLRSANCESNVCYHENPHGLGRAACSATELIEPDGDEPPTSPLFTAGCLPGAYLDAEADQKGHRRDPAECATTTARLVSTRNDVNIK